MICLAVHLNERLLRMAGDSDAELISAIVVVVRFPHESMCVAKEADGKIESAAVVRND